MIVNNRPRAQPLHVRLLFIGSSIFMDVLFFVSKRLHGPHMCYEPSGPVIANEVRG